MTQVNDFLRPVLLCILDGWGIAKSANNNAISLASTPFWDECLKKYLHSELKTSGLDVGLPDNQMGNSEVGHINIGCGRIVLQDLPRINQAIIDDTLKQNSELQNLISYLKLNNKSCHLLGLLSDGGVHSHIDHIIALTEILIASNIKCYFHGFLDGRDTSPNSAIEFIQKITKKFNNQPLFEISTICGRYYAMDRDNRWERTKKSYLAINEARGEISNDIIDSITVCYNNQISDEFIEPIVSFNYKGMIEGDGLIMANFRADRARQILNSFQEDFIEFPRSNYKKLGSQLGIVEYSAYLKNFMNTIFKPEEINNGLAEIFAKSGLKQLRISETEKYAHVTFFFNGGKEQLFEGEDRILIPSPRVATYDLNPEMSAYELTDALIKSINEKKYDLIIANFANADMVGHTGNLSAAIKAVETIDKCLQKIVAAINENNAIAFITADHGNVEQMFDLNTETRHTAHTTNPVPLLIISENIKNIKLSSGRLCDIAPTILDILNITKPKEMTGHSLITRDG
jgi:2,3-bisphosphoglycerate-independent phosphoglycerate mutase